MADLPIIFNWIKNNRFKRSIGCQLPNPLYGRVTVITPSGS